MVVCGGRGMLVGRVVSRLEARALSLCRARNDSMARGHALFFLVIALPRLASLISPIVLGHPYADSPPRRKICVMCSWLFLAVVSR